MPETKTKPKDDQQKSQGASKEKEATQKSQEAPKEKGANGKPQGVPKEKEALQKPFLLPVPSVLRTPTDSQTSSNISDRVRRLLESLEEFDSLYLCHTTDPFPSIVSNRIQRRCVSKYHIKDYYGVTRYYAAELTNPCNYYFCSNARSFQIYMYDLSGSVVFESIRNCSFALCVSGVDCCCASGVETTANFRKEENYIGNVISSGSCSRPCYKIQNVYLDEKYFVRGPPCSLIFPCFLCFIKSFYIYLPKTDGSLGKIIYGYDGLHEDRITNPKTVGVIFPPRASPEIKACLLTAGFMLDVTYFQGRGCTFHRLLRYIFMLGIVAVVIYGFYVLIQNITLP